MKQAISRLIVLITLLPVLTLAAETMDADMARIVTQSALPSDCLAPVVINNIDGTRQAVAGKGFLVEPGVHTLNGKVILDSTKCNQIDGDPGIGRTAGLEVDFEAGKTYYIAYDRSPPDPHDWKLLVWKVEQTGLPGEYSQE